MGVGVIYVVYGRKARDEAEASIKSLRKHHPDWDIKVVGDSPCRHARYHSFPDRGAPGRWAKVNLDKLTNSEHTLFLDADTRVHGKLDVGFRLLDNGYDLVMVPSPPQHNDALRHLTKEERAATMRELPLDPLQLNTGVMWFGPGAAPLFEVWRTEWLRWKDKDQGALLRALNRHPVAVAILGRPFNGGAVVEHRFGACGG
ncbi:MAG: hypothetical protein R6V11_05600 [Ectothiorhodospiraceae bacterium]